MSLPRISSAQILISDRCNHVCVHCYQVHGTKGELAFEGLVALMDELAQAGALFLVFSGGEATLRPDLPDLLRAARARHFAITLMTNGYAISDAVHDAIVETGVWKVRISLYSDIAAEHDAVTRVPGSFDRLITNVRRLRQNGVQVELAVPLLSLSTATVPRIRAIASGLGCTVSMSVGTTAREDGTDAPLHVAPTTEQLAPFLEELHEGYSPPPIAKRLTESPCGACSEGITVHSNGEVQPCTHINAPLSPNAGDIAGALTSPAHSFIASIRWADLHGCRDCALVSICQRCHGSAFFERGDHLGPQPSACRVALARHSALHGPVALAPSTDPEVIARGEGVGPFELLDDGRLRPIPDMITPHDEAIALKFPWVRGTPTHTPASPAPLVNINRLLRRLPGSMQRERTSR